MAFGALALALLCAASAGRALVKSLDKSLAAPRPTSAPLLDAERAAGARALVVRLARGLLAVQRADGGFDPWPDDPGIPQVKRTVGGSLAVAALSEALRLGSEVQGLSAARDRGLAWLRGLQEKSGAFGRMPVNAMGQADRYPGVEALAGAVLALVSSLRPEDAPALDSAVRALSREIRGGLRNGWTRALVAIVLDGVVRAERAASLDRQPRSLIPVGAAKVVDCGDYRLAEAIVRCVREGGVILDLLGDQVSDVCLADPPSWTGTTSDLQSWYMQAFLEARSPRGPAWFRGVLAAIDAATSPSGRIPDGNYADSLAQTSCAILLLGEGLSAQLVSP